MLHHYKKLAEINLTYHLTGLSLRISGSQIQLIPNSGELKTITSQSEGLQRGLPVQLVQTSTGRHIYFPLQSQAGSNTVIAGNGQRLTLTKNSTADVKLVNSNFNNSNSTNCSVAKPVNWIPTISQVMVNDELMKNMQVLGI